MSASFLQQLFGLDGQVAVVIGGTGVLCGAMAQGLAEAGATVVVAGRDAAEEGREREFAEIEPSASARRRRSASTWRQRLDRGVASVETIETHGRVDMLVNGAPSVNSRERLLRGQG